MQAVPISDTSGLTVVRSTGPGGFALQNATPPIFSWTAPSDGKLHSIAVFVLKNITVNETGGSITVSAVCGGTVVTSNIYAGSQNVGVRGPSSVILWTVDPGTTVTVAQTSALTLGVSTLFAQLFAD